MKKLLALDQGEYLGGAELFFSELLTHADQDFDIHLITGKNRVYHERYKNSSITLHPMALPALKPVGLKTFRKYRQAQKKIVELIDALKPDQIVSNTVRTHLLTSQLAQKKGIPLVWMAHDRTFPGLFLKWFKRYPQTIISCSKFVQDYYRERVGDRKELSDQVLYPFALEKDQLKSYPHVKKEKVIGMIGKFIPWKGQDLFLQMAQKVHHVYPNYRFQVIGSVYENNPESVSFYKECERLIEDLNLKSVVEIKLSINDVFAELARWEILVHCSHEPESLGRVILEGMASGCAVVATDLGGPKEIVNHEQTGLLVKPDVGPLVEGVKWYLEHPQKKEDIVRKAQEEVEKHYMWTKVIKGFKNILNHQ